MKEGMSVKLIYSAGYNQVFQKVGVHFQAGKSRMADYIQNFRVTLFSFNHRSADDRCLCV